MADTNREMTKGHSPLVSILIPNHNGEPYLKDAVESALAQTHPSIEVIVIDDGSTDLSTSTLAAFGDRIQWLQLSQSGACVARNRALELAKGEYIQYLDADDLLFPTKIEEQLPYLTSGASDLVFCRGTIFGDGKPERPKKAPIRELADTDPFLYCIYQRLSTPAPLHRRELLDRVGGFRPDVPFAQELDLHLRLTAAGARIAFHDSLLYRVRHHQSPTRISQGSRPPGAYLQILLDLSHILLKDSVYSLTSERRHALANLVAQHAIYAYRNGAPEQAATAFQMARQLDPSFHVHERKWYLPAARRIGYQNLEWCLSKIRKWNQKRRALFHATHSHSSS